MRKILGILLLIGLIAISGLASAETASYQQVAVYMLNANGGWGTPESDMGLHAKAFTSGPAFGSCDKKDWIVYITNHVTVSQWIQYSFAGTRWDWQVRKPGTFAADCISFSIKSNDDVNVAFDGFGDLLPLIHPDAAPIKVWYAYGEPGADLPPSGFITAAALNDADFQLPYSVVSQGLTKKLWNKIEILDTTRACDYENTGRITLTLTDVKYFINPETGAYNDALPSANPNSWIVK